MPTQANAPVLARALKGTLGWMPSRLRGHAVKHLAPIVMQQGFIAQTSDRGLYPFLNNLWDASRYFGIFEKDETAFLKSIVKEGMTVFDVGANVGWYTALFAHSVGPNGRVFAIEPDPSNLAKVRKIVEINALADRVQLIETAVAEKEGTLTLYLNSDSGANTIVPALGTTYGTRANGRVEVPVQTLDHIIQNHLRSHDVIDLLKIDIERAELMALHGLQNSLSGNRIKAIYIEVTDVREPDGSNQAYQVDQLLQNAGFVGHALVVNGLGKLHPQPFSPSAMIAEEGPWSNVYYTRQV